MWRRPGISTALIRHIAQRDILLYIISPYITTALNLYVVTTGPYPYLVPFALVPSWREQNNQGLRRIIRRAAYSAESILMLP